MKAKLFGFIALLVLFQHAEVSQANPVDVSYTVSGSAGNWTLDFSVTNNLGGTNQIYVLGTIFPTRNISGSPADWDPNVYSSWNNSFAGGSSLNYNVIWITGSLSTYRIGPGDTLSGFEAVYTGSTLPIGVNWYAYADSGVYTGPGCFDCAPIQGNNNPGFEGFAAQVTSPTPLPAALPLFAAGLGAMGVLGWRRKKKAAALATA